MDEEKMRRTEGERQAGQSSQDPSPSERPIISASPRRGTDTSLLKVTNIFAYIAMVAINVLAQTLPLGGLSTQQISARYPTLLTPFGLTFSIWAVIYVLLGIFTVYQALSSNKEMVRSVGWLYAATCALNIAWIFAWHYQIMVLATIAIVALWVCLRQLSGKIKTEALLVRIAFSIYYAWISVATAIQLFILASLRFPAVHIERTAVAISIAVMVLLTAYTFAKVFKDNDSFFGITIAWAMAGIFMNHIGSGYNRLYPTIIIVSGFCALAVLGAVILHKYEVGEIDTVTHQI